MMPITHLHPAPQNKYKAMSKKPSNSRYLEEYEEEEYGYESKKEKKKEPPPRFTKNCLDKVDTDEIVVNLSKTHYDVIELVVEELGWVAEHSKKSQKWDIMWTDNHIDAQDLFKLNDQQKISHFPAIEVLSRKNFLGRSLMKISKSFPQEYGFFPPTWSVPSEMGELMRFDAQHAEDDKPIYIFKPECSSQGKGISLLSNIQETEGRTGIVQTYLNSPYLIDGLKFDMRIYVLIYGCDPIRIYIYEEGLARFATESYERARRKNLKDNFVHLTNYAINKTNKKFVFNTSDKHMHVGHKRSLTSIFNVLKRRQVDVPALKQKIDSLIVKTLLVGKPMINHLYGLSQTDNLTNDHCFHVLGFDVLLDQHLEPFLLEVNHTPSFATDTPLDKSIKKNLIKETLLLLNVNLTTKKAKIDRKKEFEQKRAMRKLVKLSAEERTEQKKLIEKEKNVHEEATLKKYRKLYPLEPNHYADIEEHAQKIFNEQWGFKNKESNKEAKEAREVGSPLKPRLKARPKSIQQISTESKILNQIKTRIGSSLVGGSTTVLPEHLEKLPDIGPPRKPFEKRSTLSPQKMQIKSYEFNPEMVFAQYEEKINIQKIFIKQRISEGQYTSPQSAAFLQNKHKGRRTGGYVQPKFLNLTDNLPKHINLFEQAIEVNKAAKNDKVRHRNFNEFTSLTNREKNSNLIVNDNGPLLQVKKESPVKEVPLSTTSKVFFEEGGQRAQQLLLLKSLITTKPGNFF